MGQHGSTKFLLGTKVCEVQFDIVFNKLQVETFGSYSLTGLCTLLMNYDENMSHVHACAHCYDTNTANHIVAKLEPEC